MIWRHNLFIKDKKLAIWLEKNLIYCEDTHSFVHRLFNKIKSNKKSTYEDAQVYAFQVLSAMIRDYREITRANKRKNKKRKNKKE
jgi:hypothetical protein